MTAEEMVAKALMGIIDANQVTEIVKQYGKEQFEAGLHKGKVVQRNADVRELNEKADMLAKLPLVTQKEK